MIPIGPVSGILAFAGTASTMLGYPALGAFLHDEQTGTVVTLTLSAAAALVAGFTQGYAAWRADRAARTRSGAR